MRMNTYSFNLYDEVCRYYEETEEDKGIYLRDTISVYRGCESLRKPRKGRRS